jgi:hypothetical protein
MICYPIEFVILLMLIGKSSITFYVLPMLNVNFCSLIPKSFYYFLKLKQILRKIKSLNGILFVESFCYCKNIFYLLSSKYKISSILFLFPFEKKKLFFFKHLFLHDQVPRNFNFTNANLH